MKCPVCGSKKTEIYSDYLDNGDENEYLVCHTCGYDEWDEVNYE